MKKELWYTVKNGGDGSAYPTLMESKELCELDQEYTEEEWGESCVGRIELESDSDIHVLSEVITKEDVMRDLETSIEYQESHKGKYFDQERLDKTKEHLKKVKELK